VPQHTMRKAIWAAAILLCFGSTASFADVIVTPGSTPPFNVLNFNNGEMSPPLGALAGTTLSGYSLDVIGTNIQVQGNQIEGIGGNFTNLTFEPSSGFQNYTKLILNIDAVADGNVTFNSAPNNILGTDTFALSGNGQNFFTITASNGQSIASLTFSSDVEVSSVGQIRVLVSAVPEPGTVGMALVGLGAVAVGFLRRKKA
jgi:hypothetical protein